jgi:hypothetical protein
MLIPERVNGKWMATLDDSAIVEAEAHLHADFRTLDAAEKARLGTRYRLLQGSAPLVDAWMRWSLVNNEATKRGLAKQTRS